MNSPVRTLRTPEGVAIELQLAGGGDRVAAFILDQLVIAGTLLLLTIAAVSALASVRQGFEPVGIIWIVGGFVLRNFYFTLFEAGWRGATPGKRAMKIRVAARDGGRLGFASVAARNMMRELEVFLPLSLLAQGISGEQVDRWTAGAGVLWVAVFVLFPWLNRDRLRAGDLVAGSWVVRAPRPALLPDMGDRGLARLVRCAFTDAQLDAYGVYELQTLERVLREDDPAAIDVTAMTIRRRIGWTGSEPPSAFLQAYYAALRSRQERNLLFGRRRANKSDGSTPPSRDRLDRAAASAKPP
ncbi:MAG: RDD family protein [Sphingomonadaceae bacterium]|nr:RDD family protein [Sphingomonadaceae bacterium]